MLCCFESGNFLKLAVWSFNFVIYFRITNKVHFHLTKLMWSLDQPPLMIWINNSSKKKSYNNNKNNDNNLYLHPRNPKKKWKRLEGKWINKFFSATLGFTICTLFCWGYNCCSCHSNPLDQSYHDPFPLPSFPDILHFFSLSTPRIQ